MNVTVQLGSYFTAESARQSTASLRKAVQRAASLWDSESARCCQNAELFTQSPHAPAELWKAQFGAALCASAR